jgi:glycosyltransferase involved in cell wall biosynthesis
VRRLRGIVFLSPILAERCAPWVPEAKRFTVPNTIEEGVRCTRAEVEAKQERRNRNQHPLHLLFLSNMILSKGYLDVLHAVRILRERGTPVRCTFAGRWASDADHAAFDEIVRSAGLADTVFHHGAVRDQSIIRRLYLDADIFLLPTYYPTEAQPLTIIEAINAGTPVITTRHAGIPDIVRNGEEALYVPPRHPEAIADAVEQLQEVVRWHSMSQAARARFANVFSPESVQTKWETLLDTVT